MLCLSRKLNESIVVNGNVVITIVSIDRGKIRLGFDAPRDVPIDRLEIHQDKLKTRAVTPEPAAA